MSSLSQKLCDVEKERNLPLHHVDAQLVVWLPDPVRKVWEPNYLNVARVYCSKEHLVAQDTANQLSKSILLLSVQCRLLAIMDITVSQVRSNL